MPAGTCGMACRSRGEGDPCASYLDGTVSLHALQLPQPLPRVLLALCGSGYGRVSLERRAAFLRRSRLGSQGPPHITIQPQGGVDWRWQGRFQARAAQSRQGVRGLNMEVVGITSALVRATAVSVPPRTRVSNKDLYQGPYTTISPIPHFPRRPPHANSSPTPPDRTSTRSLCHSFLQ